MSTSRWLAPFLFSLAVLAGIAPACSGTGCAYPGLSTKVATCDDAMAVIDCLAPAALDTLPQLGMLEQDAHLVIDHEGVDNSSAVLEIGEYIVREAISVGQCAHLRALVRHARHLAMPIPDSGTALLRPRAPRLPGRDSDAFLRFCGPLRARRAVWRS